MSLQWMVCPIKNWKKNYRDINQLPYYSYMYKDDSPEVPVVPGVVPVVPRPGGGIPLVVAAVSAGPASTGAKSRPTVNWAKAARAVTLVNKFQLASAAAHPPVAAASAASAAPAQPTMNGPVEKIDPVGKEYTLSICLPSMVLRK